MRTLRTLTGAALIAALSAAPAAALEDYSDAQEAQFLDWCTGVKGASDSTCSCTLKSLAATVPSQALALFLSSQGQGGMPSLDQTLISTTATVTQALTVCSR